MFESLTRVIVRVFSATGAARSLDATEDHAGAMDQENGEPGGQSAEKRLVQRPIRRGWAVDWDGSTLAKETMLPAMIRNCRELNFN